MRVPVVGVFFQLIERGSVMDGRNLVFTSLIIYVSIFLFTVGCVGIITRAPLVHRWPYAFHRPSVYILMVGLVFLDSVVAYFGEKVAFTLFLLVIADIIYEVVRPFLSHSVEIEGSNSENIRSDIVNAFRKLNLRYEGNYPSFTLPDEHARLKVKYWPNSCRAVVTIDPRSKTNLLLEIARVVGRDFEAEEGRGMLRGYFINIFIAISLFIFALWQFISRSYG